MSNSELIKMPDTGHTFPKTLEYGDYQFIRELAHGGQGFVTLYRHIKTNKDYAVKFDPETIRDANILGECLFLKNNGQNMKHVPQYVQHMTINCRRYLIMDYLEKSLE